MSENVPGADPERAVPLVTLDHLIVLARNKAESAEFLTWLLGLPPAVPQSIFLAVELGSGVTLLVKEEQRDFPGQHYAFRVARSEFKVILSRVRDRNLEFWATPRGGALRKVYTQHGERGFYLRDPAGHQLEVLTDN